MEPLGLLCGEKGKGLRYSDFPRHFRHAAAFPFLLLKHSISTQLFVQTRNKIKKTRRKKRFSHYTNPWFRYGKSSAFQRPSVFSARTSFSCLWQRNKFSNKSIKLSSFSLFNTGPLRAAQQKEGDPCGRARGSLSIAIQHVSRGGGGAFVSQQDPALHLQPFRIYRLFIRHSEPQRTFTSSQERHLSNPPGRPPSGCCVPWSVAFFAQPAFSFSGQVTDETQKSSQVKS